MFKKPINIISFLLLFVFAILPLVLGFGFAVAYSFGLIGVLNKGFTLENWLALFENNDVVISFIYSAWLAIASLTISVVVSMAIAINFNKKFSKGIYSYLVYMPLAFPSIVAAFFFAQFLGNAGILSRICYQLGIIDKIQSFPNLINDQYSIGIIIAQFFLSLPFFTLLYTGLYQTERIDDYTKLANSLGAKNRQSIFRISIPILFKKSFPNIVLYFIFKIGAYEVPLLLGRSSPETVSVLAVRKLQKFNLYDIPQGYAIAVIYTIIILSLLMLVLKTNKNEYDI
ncbi:ABC transporter permease subunit [Pedobacter sp. SD-b]|uniref:ABC transporter permease subunit n=1 Tax=Pedobacter segetis TaxID=2793069 RepID=A0ABS1BLU3_9SPHI|nr:ABC transporter permease subunit [Pedobacter segetis]MBK0383848.1 ABC transporter permease subunit [Pedobacter segetis]